MNETLQSIEALRAALYKLVDDVDGNLLHPSVIVASERLDAEIMKSRQPALTPSMRMAAV
jgi:hypothetical protein